MARSKIKVEWDRELAKSRSRLTAPVNCEWRRGLWKRNRQKWIDIKWATMTAHKEDE